MRCIFSVRCNLLLDTYGASIYVRVFLTATPHRVIGGKHERLSVPLFFNPRYDVNVAPAESGKTILAGDHLSKRYDETYLHRRIATKK